MRSLLLWADGNPGAATGKFTPRGLPLKGVGRFEISLLPRCRHCLNVINKTRQARNGARPCANGAVALIRFSRFSVRRDCLAGADYSELLFMCVSVAMSEALSWMAGGLRHRRICRQMRRFTPQRAWFHRTYFHRRPHQMRRNFSIRPGRRRQRRPVPEPLPLRPSSESKPPIPLAWSSH